MIAVLYDSSCRLGEIAGLKRKDVECINGQWTICVDGKTGVRNVPLMSSPLYLEEWYDKYHPYKNPNAPLWISRSPRLRNRPIEQQALSHNAIWKIVKNGENYIPVIVSTRKDFLSDIMPKIAKCVQATIAYFR